MEREIENWGKSSGLVDLQWNYWWWAKFLQKASTVSFLFILLLSSSLSKIGFHFIKIFIFLIKFVKFFYSKKKKKIVKFLDWELTCLGLGWAGLMILEERRPKYVHIIFGLKIYLYLYFPFFKTREGPGPFGPHLVPSVIQKDPFYSKFKRTKPDPVRI